MDDSRYADMARECGFDNEDFDDLSAPNSDAQYHATLPPKNMYDDHADYTDDIMYSSPCPPERHVAQSVASTTYALHYQPSYPHNDEDITQYEDEEYSTQYQDEQIYNSSPHGNGGPVMYSQEEHNYTHTPNVASHGHINQAHLLQSQPSYSQAPLRQYQNPQGRPSNPMNLENGFPTLEPESDPSRGNNPRNGHGIRLRPVSELPDMYRGMFKFGVFNAVQSTCFDCVLSSNENMVISAPTGSGKTVLFELAIIRMLTAANNTGQSLKCVYMAPTKALCSERYRDWAAKFDPLGVKCCELTGDTVLFGKGAWGDARNASIIITTGEKWDSLTRNWGDHGKILSQIQLFLVDEVHILHESRGSTLEVVISRMKSRGSAVRFVLVSATVPNIQDIASWIGTVRSNGDPAKVFEFGEEFRPCKLTRFVYGVPRQKSQNDFLFTRTLDYRLFPALQTHSVGKPILVFCSTRKGVFTTAEHLLKDFTEAEKNKQSLPWSRPSHINHVFHDKRLSDLAVAGIGVHHAGLHLEDRRGVEDLYLKKILRIVVATSTLAVGVNLPAHTVVIKGVQMFQNNASVEYSDLDVMQMLGRAGRPQFDKDGIAIILCEVELENKYKSLVQGTTILESCLHTNLSEHLNSEIGLGTITNITSAKEWLRNSFLFQRIQKNPKHYALGKGDKQTWEERVDDLVMQSVEKLQKTELVAYAGEGDTSDELSSTEYGDIMSKFYIRQSTMSLILALPERATLREILEMISASEELSETKMRASEKTPLNKLRRHNDIRFEMKKIEKTSDKIFLLIQAVLGGISLNAPEYKSSDSQPHLEAFSVFRHIARIARAIVEVAIVKKLGAQIKFGLELVRCLTAKAWEDRPVVLRQIEQIGEKSLKVLAEQGITSLDALRKQDTLRIETLLNRRPPFGLEVLASVRELPKYCLKITEVEICSSGGTKPVEIDLSIECSLVKEQLCGFKPKKQKGRGINMTAVLTLTSDMQLIDFRRIPTRALKEVKTFEVTAELQKPSQSVIVYITSESIAGVTVSHSYKPKIAAKEYPTMDTRPMNSVDLDLMGLEDNPDFWKMDVDENGDEVVPTKDLTKPRAKTPKSKQSDTRTSNNAPSNALQVLDRPPAEHKVLPNGNYACNHPCKDKMKCRHLCCREGLAAPPQMKKRIPTCDKLKPETHHSYDSPKIPTSMHDARPKAKATKSAIQPDRKLAELESLHERTNVASSLKLPEGQRLKLELPKQIPSKRKRPVPNFDIEFADLNDSGPSATNFDVAEIEDDDDDLPELHDILNLDHGSGQKKRTPSSETNYSNSEIDALIRDLPLDEEQEPPSMQTKFKTPMKQKGNTARYSMPLPSTPSPSLRRSQVTHHATPPRKRARPMDVQADSSSPMSRPRYTKDGALISGRSQGNEPLFYDLSENERIEWREAETTLYQDPRALSNQEHLPLDDDEFTLDCDSIDILPATPPLTMSTTRCDSKKKSSSSALTMVDNAMPNPPTFMQTEDAKRNKPKAQDVYQHEDDTIEEVDEFAELEAWLKSGAVDIVYS